jgi:hypothetical protein
MFENKSTPQAFSKQNPVPFTLLLRRLSFLFIIFVILVLNFCNLNDLKGEIKVSTKMGFNSHNKIY